MPSALYVKLIYRPPVKVHLMAHLVVSATVVFGLMLPPVVVLTTGRHGHPSITMGLSGMVTET